MEKRHRISGIISRSAAAWLLCLVASFFARASSSGVVFLFLDTSQAFSTTEVPLPAGRTRFRWEVHRALPFPDGFPWDSTKKRPSVVNREKTQPGNNDEETSANTSDEMIKASLFRFFHTNNTSAEAAKATWCATEWARPDRWPPLSGASFDWRVSTHLAYQQPQSKISTEQDLQETPWFTSPYRRARSKLDYEYHRNPAIPRQMFQDGILQRVLNRQTTSGLSFVDNENNSHDNISNIPEQHSTQSVQDGTRPWIVFTAGPMGVGKSYVLTQLYQRGIFPLQDFVKIDPDLLKNELPEMAGYLDYHAKHPEKAPTLLHRESTQLSEILMEEALHEQRNLVIDGSLRDVKWYTELFAKLRDRQPHYRLAILYVSADPDQVRQRAAQRGNEDGEGVGSRGRAVPSDVLEESLRQVPRSVEALKALTDYTWEISNNDNEPLTLDVLQQPTDSLASLQPVPPTLLSHNSNNKISYSWEWFANLWRDNGDRDQHVNAPIQPKTSNSPSLNHRPAYGHRMPPRVSSTPEKMRPKKLNTDPIICGMETAFDDSLQHAMAREIWGDAYPQMCPRCAVACDGQCGICIHNRHRCACPICCRKNAASTSAP